MTRSTDPGLNAALEEDAVKLEAMGQDPGPTLEDLAPVSWKVWSSLYEGFGAAVVADHPLAPLETIAEVRKYENANVLSAAREMLAALKDVVAKPNAQWKAQGGLGGHPGYEQANAAIAKAEGRVS